MYAFAKSLQKLSDRAHTLFRELSLVDNDEDARAAWLEKWYQIEELEHQKMFEQGQLVTDPKLLQRKRSRTHKLIEKAEKEGRLRALRALLLEDCQRDMQLIQAIQQEFANLFTNDPKLQMILQKIQENSENNQKILCISHASDTAYAVYSAVMADPLLAQKGVGFLTSSEKDEYAPAQINGQIAAREDILSRFAPRSWPSGTKRKINPTEQRYPATIDILIGSDTLSVGQNLQDARVLLNLDLCWNPMQHEQRIGRIDRPRHKEDSGSLDIYYFLNLDLIEAELALRKTLEERLISTYQDTAFDDEIFPGYFEMIEQFSRLRKEKKNDLAYTAQANALLEQIAERSARPPEEIEAENELEIAALHHLQEVARSFARTEEPELSSQLVSIGRVPYCDWRGSPYATRPSSALVAEICFQVLDQQKHAVGKAIYHHVYVSLDNEETLQSVDPKISIDDVSLVPVVEGFLAESSRIPLRRKHITYLQAMLAKLEEYTQQALEDQKALLRRQKRYQRYQCISENNSIETLAQVVEANLVNIRLLV